MSLLAIALLFQDGMPKPGEHHEHMKAFLGTWEAVMTMNGPDGPKEAGKGTQTDRLTGGGLWLVTDFEGEFEGMSFSGHGTSGFDAEEGKHVGVWADSMSDYLQHSTGECSDDGKTLTMMVKVKNPESGGWGEMKEVSRIVDADTKTLTFYAPTEDGGWTEIMKIDYKRKK